MTLEKLKNDQDFIDDIIYNFIQFLNRGDAESRHQSQIGKVKTFMDALQAACNSNGLDIQIIRRRKKKNKV